MGWACESVCYPSALSGYCEVQSAVGGVNKGVKILPFY